MRQYGSVSVLVQSLLLSFDQCLSQIAVIISSVMNVKEVILVMLRDFLEHRIAERLFV